MTIAFILTISDEEKMNANSKNWSILVVQQWGQMHVLLKTNILYAKKQKQAGLCDMFTQSFFLLCTRLSLTDQPSK